METLTVSIDNPAETVGLLKEALAKEKFFLQLGIEKNQARIRQFEQRYTKIGKLTTQIWPNGKVRQKSYGD